jgi:hypothetical protein
LNLVAATSTLIDPDELAVGVTTKVADRPLLAMLKVPFVPPVTVMSSVMNPVTASLKVNVNVTSPVVMVATETLSVIATVGAVVSGVVPPPPQAESKAAAEMAHAESLKLRVFTDVSFGLILMKSLSSMAKKN